MSMSKRKFDEEGQESSGSIKRQKDGDADVAHVKKEVPVKCESEETFFGDAGTDHVKKEVTVPCEKVFFGKTYIFARSKVHTQFLHLFIDDRKLRIYGNVEIAPQNERIKLAFEISLDKIDHFRARILAPKYKALEIYVKPEDQNEENQKMLEHYRYNLDKNGHAILKVKFNADTSEEIITTLREVLASHKIDYTK